MLRRGTALEIAPQPPRRLRETAGLPPGQGARQGRVEIQVLGAPSRATIEASFFEQEGLSSRRGKEMAEG
eukprot:9407521-Pyramimonas_sp.AAC.1